MTKEILKQSEEKMHKAAEVVRQELAKIRTGKATTALLDGIKVEYYGSHMALHQVANVSVMDVHTISVQPWDKNMVAPIVPCHRIVRTGGGLGGYYYGLPVKEWLLAHERGAEQLQL